MRRDRRKRRKKITEISISIFILVIIFFFGIREYKESKVGKIRNNYEISKTQIAIYEDSKQSSNNIRKYDSGNKENIKNNNQTSLKENKKREYPKEEIIDNYKGYKVSAKLEIPVISLKTYVISEFSTKALNISVTKFWGVNPNEIGNYCIAGHNFRNKNMFHNLKKLKIDDELYLTDAKIGKVKYQVYEILQVFPNDVSSLSQDTLNKEVTLITCTSDSKKRIIIKAKEELK